MRGASAASSAQSTGSISGTITTSAKGLAPVRVTIDQKICGAELPDNAIVVDGAGRLANAVVILTGVKRAAPAEADGDNEKCHFAPRVQIARPNANVRTTSKDPILHTTNAQLENGRTIFNVALPIAGLNISKPIGGAGMVPPELQHASLDARMARGDRRGRRGHRRRRPFLTGQHPARHLRASRVARGVEIRAAESDRRRRQKRQSYR